MGLAVALVGVDAVVDKMVVVVLVTGYVVSAEMAEVQYPLSKARTVLATTVPQAALAQSRIP